MKPRNNNNSLPHKVFISLITVGLFLTGISSSRAESWGVSEKQLWEMNPPDLPPLRNSSAYLFKADEVFNLKLVLRLGKKVVDVYDKDKVVASFPVAVGKQGWETPQGEFEIMQMVKDPSWQNPWSGKVTPPGPNNPLGERWIGFWTDGKNFIGFHGTPGEHLIGQAVSHGCVRMRNKDIKQLFELVSVGTPVTVVKWGVGSGK